MNVEVYDIETLNNCFTYTGYNTKDNKWYLWEQFILVDIRPCESTNPWA